MIDPARIAAAMQHLDQRAEGGRCEEMVAEMIFAADSVPVEIPDSMAEYWRRAIGESYTPVKWNPRYAHHPERVRMVLASLKAEMPCPEAADVVVGLIHKMCVMENREHTLMEQIKGEGLSPV